MSFYPLSFYLLSRFWPFVVWSYVGESKRDCKFKWLFIKKRACPTINGTQFRPFSDQIMEDIIIFLAWKMFNKCFFLTISWSRNPLLWWGTHNWKKLIFKEKWWNISRILDQTNLFTVVNRIFRESGLLEIACTVPLK